MRDKSLIALTRRFRGVEDELIGRSVRVVRITDATRKKIAEHNPNQIANWDLFYCGYCHGGHEVARCISLGTAPILQTKSSR
jgi:hypothetical protein